MTTNRPLMLENFVGQDEIKNNLKVFIQSAVNQKKALDHVLFYGPPGLGKTSLANIVANELGVDFVPITATTVNDSADLIKMLSGIKENSVVFIDEIHRLNPKIEETLYSALEDFKFYAMVGERQIIMDLPKFTLIGATTKLGGITKPLRDRFGIQLHLRFYNTVELSAIVTQAIGHLNETITEESAQEIAIRSRGTPRIAIHMLKRVHDYNNVKGNKAIDLETTKEALKHLDIDTMGLNNLDQRYLDFIHSNYTNKAVGLETISAGLYEDNGMIKDAVEPYLIKIGFVQKTPKGRMLTAAAMNYMAKV